MESSAVDAVEFRAGQRRDWDAAATGWRTWSDWLDTAAGHISERMVELAAVEPGSRVLDVAAGYGEPALTAARRAGPQGSVVATDISAEMLDYGRERATAAGIENVEFVESDAMSLDFAPNSFDASLSRWGIIFEPDAESAAARVRGFLREGARMAISSWGPAEQVPFLGVALRVAMKRLDVPPPPPGTPGPLSRPTPDALSALLEGGGFSNVEVEEATVDFEWPSPEEYTRYIQEIAPPVRAMIEPHPEEVQSETWAAITEEASKHAGAGGALRLPSLTLLAVGTA